VSRSDWPIVVGGCHRSGTSVVRRMLDSHPDIHCGPEVTFFRDFYDAYQDDPLRHLRFSQTARTLLPEPELLDVLGRSFVDLHLQAARRAGKRRWADKAPDNVLYLEEWGRLLGREWLFVHVVRNPLDTVASMAEIGFPLTLPADLEGRIAFYRRYAQAGFVFGHRHRDRCRLVVYERLVAEPEPEVSRLMDWLGETFDPLQLAFNDVPHTPGLEDPKIATTTAIHAESVGRWRALLSPQDAATVWEATADLWERIDPGFTPSL
jgi:Sulfotransferase family